jgi:hypothetical protein
MSLNGTVYQLPNLALTTTEIGSGSYYATPTVNDSKNSTLPPSQGKRSSLVGDMIREREMLPTPTTSDQYSASSPEYLEKKGRNPMTNQLRDAVRYVEERKPIEYWPTPTAAEANKIPACANYGQVGLNNNPRIRGLPTRPKKEKSGKKMLPTPTASSSQSASMEASLKEAKRLHPKGQNHLAAEVASQMFLTPTARDWKGGYNTKSLTRKDGKSRAMDALPNAVLNGKGTETVSGQLNPQFVEWLMGYPMEYTKVE